MQGLTDMDLHVLSCMVNLQELSLKGAICLPVDRLQQHQRQRAVILEAPSTFAGVRLKP